MRGYSPLLERLINELTKLPGIGRKSAQRVAFYLLKAPEDYAVGLAETIKEVKASVRPCVRCGNLTEKELCYICDDAGRDPQLICVVEEPADIPIIERTGEFRGLYHVLMGVISPLDNVGPDQLRIRELVERVRSDGVREVIVATDPDVEGDTTAYYISKLISPLGPTVTRLARGLPVGGDLDFADEATLAKAILGRQEI